MKVVSKRKKIISVFILSLAIPLTVYFVLIGIKYRSSATSSSATLSFSQPALSLDPLAHSATPINLVLDAGTSKIGFVKTSFSFDKTQINLASEIIPTTLMKKIVSQTSMSEANSTGQVVIVFGLDPIDIANPPTGGFNLAVFNFQALASASSSSKLSFVASGNHAIDMNATELTLTTNDTTVNIFQPTTLPSPTLTPAPTETRAPTASPTATAISTGVPTATPNVSTGNFSIKLQGISKQGENKIPVITLKQGSQSIYSTNNYRFSSDASGTYSGSIPSLPIGIYDIYIKTDGYLQKKFPNIILINGANNLDWTGTPLLAGDLDGNNKINITDIAQILSVYTALSVPVAPANQKYDLNGDGIINIIDISLLLGNYTQLEVLGD